MMQQLACRCGCGALFTPKNLQQLYVSGAHRLSNGQREARRRKAKARAETPRPCACGCGVTVAPESKRHRYATRTCASRARARRKTLARLATKGARFPKAKYIHEALRDTPPGLCPWCDESLPPRCVTSCGKRECARAYNWAYRVGRYEALRKPHPSRQCATCKGDFVPRLRNASTCSTECSRAFSSKRRQEKRRALIAANPKPRGRPKTMPPMLFGRAAGPKVLRPFA